MKEKKQSDLSVLLGYAGSYKGLTFLGLGLSAVAMLLSTIVLMFVFDWRMGAACLLAAVVSVGAMFTMGGKNAKLIARQMRTVEAADKIVVLKEGKVAEEGSPEKLLAKEGSMFRRMTTLQAASAGWSI